MCKVANPTLSTSTDCAESPSAFATSCANIAIATNSTTTVRNSKFRAICSVIKGLHYPQAERRLAPCFERYTSTMDIRSFFASSTKSTPTADSSDTETEQDSEHLQTSFSKNILH